MQAGRPEDRDRPLMGVVASGDLEDGLTFTEATGDAVGRATGARRLGDHFAALAAAGGKSHA